MTKNRQQGPSEAGDFLEQLANDPEYQARMREKEAQRAAIAAESAKDSAGLIKELQEAGVHVVLEPAPWEPNGYAGPPRSIDDLVNAKKSAVSRYAEAIPILVKHLQMEHLPNIKEGIVWALAVAEGRGIAFEPLVQEFCRTHNPDSGYKWGVGCAIAQTATPETVPTVLELIRDKRHGKARQELPLALLCLPMDEAQTLLEPLREDPDLAKCATEALKRIRSKRIREKAPPSP